MLFVLDRRTKIINSWFQETKETKSVCREKFVKHSPTKYSLLHCCCVNMNCFSHNFWFLHWLNNIWIISIELKLDFHEYYIYNFPPAGINPDYAQQYWLWWEEVSKLCKHTHSGIHTCTSSHSEVKTWQEKKGPYSYNEEKGSCQEADDAALVFTARKERWSREGEGEKERRLCSSYIIGDFREYWDSRVHSILNECWGEQRTPKLK